MITWILIMTIAGQTSQTGSAISTVEMSSQSTCIAAGNAWLSRMDHTYLYERDGKRYYSAATPSFVCVTK